MRGYAGKFLDIDLSTEKTKEASFNEDVLRSFIGGRGLAAKILWDRLGKQWETVDPFGPENILLVLTGPLTGFFPGGRVCVSGKSPQSNGMIGSTVAGEFGIDLKCAGYDGLIITGKAQKPSYLSIIEEEVFIRDATHVWGKEGKQTLKILTKDTRKELHEKYPRYGELKEPSILYIGPAGENKTRIAAVMAKWSHAAGYGGYGGIMGAKNLKAIVAKGLGPLPEVENIEKVAELIKTISKKCYKADLWRRWGTGAGGYSVGAKTSSEPVRNWQEEWHDQKGYAVDKFEQRLWIKQYWGDFGCPTTCLKIAMPKTGEFKGAITDNPDYELQAYLGPNLGIFAPEDNVYLSAVIDDLGLCGIQAGNVLGFAAELYQRSFLSKEDLGVIDLIWGNAKAFAALAKKIAIRDGIGNTLAEGSYRAALELGKMKNANLLPFVVHEKGVAIGAHGIRSTKDYTSNISFACSVQAGDHTSAAGLPVDHGGEMGSIIEDSGVYCSFNTFALNEDQIWGFFEAATGWQITHEEWYRNSGLRILQIQRAMLLLGGPDHQWNSEKDDENPPRFYEPLPSGPYAGKTTNRKTFEESKQEYYEAVGWDKKGIPKPETLRKLGLNDVEEKLRVSGILTTS
jgi:aldehyde:ferredoxin oxidoreductase